MAELPRLNGVIKGWNPASRRSPPSRKRNRRRDRDVRGQIRGIIYEMEHNPWTSARCAIAAIHAQPAARSRSPGSVAPGVPRWCAFRERGERRNCKPSRRSTSAATASCADISSVDEAYNAVAACRYPRSRTSRSTSAGHPRRRAGQAGGYWGISSRTITTAPTSGRQSQGRDFRDPDDGEPAGSKASTTSSPR